MQPPARVKCKKRETASNVSFQLLCPLPIPYEYLPIIISIHESIFARSLTKEYSKSIFFVASLLPCPIAVSRNAHCAPPFRPVVTSLWQPFQQLSRTIDGEASGTGGRGGASLARDWEELTIDSFFSLFLFFSLFPRCCYFPP